MMPLGIFLKSLAKVLNWGLGIYFWIIVARALVSFVNPDPYNPIVRFLYRVTDPVLSFLRRRFGLVYGGLDFSPMVVLGAIYFLQEFLVNILYSYGSQILQQAGGQTLQ